MQHIQIQLKLPFTQQMLPLARAQATNKAFHPYTFKRQASPGTHSHSASVCAQQNCLLGSHPIGKVFQCHWSPGTNITGTKAKSIQPRSVLGEVILFRRWLSSDGKKATRQTYFSTKKNKMQSTGSKKHLGFSISPGQSKKLMWWLCFKVKVNL